MVLFLIFIVIPVVEIGLFISVGGAIGLWPTLAMIVLTAVIGARLVKKQGLEELAKLQASMGEMANPTRQIAAGAMIILAGAFLITPGFFTDALGFSLLVPGIREFIFEAIKGKLIGDASQVWDTNWSSYSASKQDTEQDGPCYDYEDLNAGKKPTHLD